MKTSKILTQWANDNNLIVIPIRYRHQFGYCKRYGFDICKKETFKDIEDKEFRNILFSLEPVDYYSGDKWYLQTVYSAYSDLRYWKRICKRMLANIKTDEKSFFVMNANVRGLNK